MKRKHSMPIGFGIVLAVVAAVVIGAAMLSSEQGEELWHSYRDVKNTRQDSMELMGNWRGMVLVNAQSPTAQKVGEGPPWSST